MDTKTDDAPNQDLNAVIDLINGLARKAAGGSYVYRGEPALYEKVSSGLYRRYKNQATDGEGYAIQAIQDEIIVQAKSHAPQLNDAGDFEALSQIQHNGGATNLIDFTTDYLIALFFACDGEPDQPGRIILLSKDGDGYSIDSPTSPAQRVIAQKSVFVRPNKGFVEPTDTALVPACLKQSILDHLRRNHGISTETIYNDIYGFIQHQDIHRDAYADLYAGITLYDQGNYNLAIHRYSNALKLNPRMATAYSRLGEAHYRLGEYDSAISNYRQALSFNPENGAVHLNLGLAYAGKRDHRRSIQHYDQALELNPDDHTYYFRIEAFLILEQWDEADEAIRFAALARVNTAAIFRQYYSNVSDFERQNNLRLPDDIAELLGGRETSA